MSLPQQLMFQVGLIDKISKPLGHVRRELGALSRDYRDGTHTMIAGAAGVAGAGIALQQALMPAIEMDRSLGEVKSLGVMDSVLNDLSATALDFAVDYGKSASEFVAASYDIQSAIGGLAGKELATFTKASGVLAAATKADTATITGYMGTMYGIFQQQANAMGKADWVEMVAGQTAKAVQMFKTTGSEMSGAFTALGAFAESSGVAMHEQMAVMGQLQATMSGAEAGTKYRRFLGGVAKAQAELGLQFTDSQGRMLPMLDILQKLRGRFGDTLDEAEKFDLKKAFGSDQALMLITQLYNQTDSLAQSIDQLGKVKGLDTAEQMAAAMTDQWERLEQGLWAVRAGFGGALLPVILPVVGQMADMSKELLAWTQTYPHLTELIGMAGMAVLGLVAAGGLLTLIVGVSKQAMVAFDVALKLVRAGLWLTKGAVWLTTTAFKLLRASLFAARLLMISYGVTAKASAAMHYVMAVAITAAKWAFGGLATVLNLMKGAVLAVNGALLANPIVLIVAGVVAAIAAVGALIYYWDDLKATFGDTWWFQAIEAAISALLTPFDALLELAQGLADIFSSGWDWLADKLNLSPGVELSTTATASGPGTGEHLRVPALTAARPTLTVPQGGVGRQMAKMNAAEAGPSKVSNWGGVTIVQQTPVTPDQLNEWELMNTP